MFVEHRQCIASVREQCIDLNRNNVLVLNTSTVLIVNKSKALTVNGSNAVCFEHAQCLANVVLSNLALQHETGSSASTHVCLNS